MCIFVRFASDPHHAGLEQLRQKISNKSESIEGRLLKLGEKNDVPKLQTRSKFLVKETRKLGENLHGDSTNETLFASESLRATPPSPAVNGAQAPVPPGHVDDFRPTTPGHSPGVGNFLQN
ncbi:hypothetical protein L1049_025004 [Liquidambar formosana]|uniref:Uncharacterized protein n=1 Tax=Liquidambar formosana TaxID=63359 RepID=A0AAP0X592_LIQFO